MTTYSLRRHVTVALCMLLLGGAIGVSWQYWFQSSATKSPHKIKTENLIQEPEVLYWYDPMVPNQHFDKPGKSPFMDMELVPKYAAPPNQTPGLTVDADLVQNLGMRKVKVQRTFAPVELDVPGILAFNERNQVIIQLRADGFVEKVWPLAVGDRVSAGQPIAEIQVPAWLEPQNELLSQSAANNPQLLKIQRARLQLLGMPDTLIAEVEELRQPVTRVTISVPINGVIALLGIKSGMTLASGDTLVQINGIDSLWLDAAVPERHATQLQPGDKATFYPNNPDVPGLSGRVEYLLPTINETARTATARILLDNPEGRLKPGTSGHVRLQSSTEQTALFVPTEAVIRTGKRTLVMLAEPQGRFRPVEVIPGHEFGNQTLIRAGLEEGQEIVTGGQFLLDSEASLLGITIEEATPHTMETQP